MGDDRDEDDTPIQTPRPRKAWKTATERDIPSIAARKERAQSHAEIVARAHARDQVDDLASAVEEVDDATPERESWDDIITDISAEQMREIERQPLLKLLVAKISHERKRRANQISEAMGKKPPKQQIQSLARRVNVMWWLLSLALTTAGGSAVAVAKWWHSSGVEQGTHEVHHQILEQHDEDHERRIRAVEDRSQQNAQRIDDLMWRQRTGVLTPPSVPQTLSP